MSSGDQSQGGGFRMEHVGIDESHLLMAMLDSMPDHIYFKDAESRFILINNAMIDVLELEEVEDAYGKTDFDYFTEEHASQAFNDEQEIIRTGVPIIGKEEKETWPDGSVTWVTTTKVPLKNDAGEIVGTFGISRDITELKRGQEAIKESEQKRVMLESIGTVCHHMGQPATVILGNSQMLENMSDDLDESVAASVSEIAVAAKALSETLHKLNEINEYHPTRYIETEESTANILEL